MAQKAPAARGSRARRLPSARATAVPCIGPAPPAATRVKVAGLWPRSMLSRSTACSRFCSSRRMTPAAASSTERPSGLASLVSMALRASVGVERDGTAGQRARAQPAQHELGVGDGRVLAAQPVGGGAGARAGALRADMQQAGIVDPGDRAAAGADRVDLHRRRREVIAVDREFVGDRHLAARHHHHVAARAADLHRDQVGLLTRCRAQPLSAPTPAAGPDRTSITGRAATRSTETAPPLLCSSSSERGRPSWRSCSSSACR